MQIKSLKANQTELHKDDGTIVFFSYETPVAACLGDGSGFVRTIDKYSSKTTRHINQWLAGAKAKYVNQAEIEDILINNTFT